MDWDSYLSDGSHPNDEGFELLATTILDLLKPSDFTTSLSFDRPNLISPLHKKAKNYIRKSYEQTIEYSPPSDLVTPRLLKTGSWSDNTSTTAGDEVQILFIGDELFLGLNCDSGVVNLYVDQELIYENLDLTAVASGDRYLPVFMEHPGVHTVTIKVVSGTVKFNGFVSKKTNIEVIGVNDSRITYTGEWTDLSDSYFTFGANRKYTTGDSSQSFEFDFYGTGIGIECNKYVAPTYRKFAVEIDGVSLGDVYPKYTNGIANRYGGVILAEELDYKKHHAKVTVTGQNTITCIFSLDAIATP